MKSDELIRESIIVAAHPDDEILWFSSIIENVKLICLCYLECPSNLKWSEGRKKSIDEYPLTTMINLGVEEAVVFADRNWINPKAATHGLEIEAENKSTEKYIENYYSLKMKIKNVIGKYNHVFTHSPWGEYGNEEHVQVYRIIKDLQKEMGFDIWFSNYVSNKSIPFAVNYLKTRYSTYFSINTNKSLSEEIINLYKKNECWTWYDNWQCFDTESFVKDEKEPIQKQKYGHHLPLNFISVEIDQKPANKQNTYIERILKKIKNFC